MCGVDEGLIIFSKKYETGISIIDEHHRSFSGIINLLYSCIRHDTARKAAMPIIAAFKYNMGVHYQTERLLLTFSDDAYAALYDMKYTDLCRRLAIVGCEVRKDFDADCLVRFLNSWLLRHLERHAEFFLPYEIGRAHV